MTFDNVCDYKHVLIFSVIVVRTAIPMVMGANIGTSMTSTLVSLTHMTDAEQVKLALYNVIKHEITIYIAI